MQILINGIIQGLLFALMGVAFALVYNTTRVFHVALGAIFALAPYVYMTSLNFGLPAWLSYVPTFIICCIVGLLCEILLHWPFSRKMAPPEVHLIGSLGMFLVIIQVIVLIWGNDTQVLRSGVDTVFTFGELHLAKGQVFSGLMAMCALILIFALLFAKSEVGLNFRAMADNPILLSLLGRNVRLIRISIFLLSALAAAVASTASALDVGFDPYGGMKAVLIGMIAAIVGGRGSFIGAAVAGLLLGIIRSQVVWYSSARWEETVTFIILSLILFIRPQGIFGRKLRLEEKA
jgi:branched-chain amino acid transport system permease protein